MELVYPCSVNWDTMSDTDHGKHCSQCDRTIHDLTQADETTIEELYQKNGKDLCGRFKASALAPVRPSTLLLLATAASILTSMHGFGQVETSDTLPTLDPTNHRESIQSVTIKGTITDKSTHEPIPFANVLIDHNGTFIAGSTTDFDGNYRIVFDCNTDKTYQLSVKMIGYTPLTIPINKNFKGGPLHLTVDQECFLTGVIVIPANHTPLIDKWNTSSGATFREEEIRRMPRR